MQHSRLRLVDLNYHCHDAVTSPDDVLALHAASDGYAFLLNEKMDVSFVKHANCDLLHKSRQISFRFFKSRNRFWHIPFASHSYIKKLQPDIVLVQGLVFPLQVILLSVFLGRKTAIIVQHHGEKPFGGLKLLLQRVADKFIRAYIFTSTGNAAAWIDKKIIGKAGKCHEVLEASAEFIQQDKAKCRALLGMKEGMVFLWVGRLHPLKDPITVLKSFEKFISTGAAATMYMVFQTEELLPEIQLLLNSNPQLKKVVNPVGKIVHKELAAWYSAADFFVSGSHKEGSGYALIEAMACGCIPLVTNIPSFKKITGSAGFLFDPGDIIGLYNLFCRLSTVNKESFSARVKNHFTSELSFEKIAENIHRLCLLLNSE